MGRVGASSGADAAVDDDDVYGSFQTAPAAPGTWATEAPPPPSAFPIGGAPAMAPAAVNPLARRPGSNWAGGPVQSSYGGKGAITRPMTSNQASGFSATGYGTGASFDPTGQARNAVSGPAPPLLRRAENSPEEKCAEMERLVTQLLDESAAAATRGDIAQALEKAKEAGKKERALCKQREQLNLADQINVDLTYAVLFNLAVQYQRSGLSKEALNTYTVIVRNKQYAQSGRLRVNMGNIHFEQKNYVLAIRMYRLALEEIPPSGRELRFKVMRNIGNSFVKMGQFKDAIGAYEAVMDATPDIVTGFNLLLCYYALGEKEAMKRCFVRLLDVKVPGSSGDEEEDEAEEQRHDVLVHDALRAEVRERRKQFLHYVLTAARLIAPVVGRDWCSGFDHVIEQLKRYEMRDSSSQLSSELEMCKALNFLKHKQYREAIDGLKAFEKKDKALRARAATNLSYLYFLEGDLDNGERCADTAITHDRYNPRALVNKGNFAFARGDYEKARGYFNQAIQAEGDNVEAIYNLGLATKQLGRYEEALQIFKRLQSIIDSVEVIFQIADLYDHLNDHRAAEWFHRLIGRVPTDPNVLARLGLLHVKDGDETQAFHHYLEAYRYYQVNMDVISWLGAYFVKNEAYDKAMTFFQRASEIQPQEVKWQLMVASCHRRRGDYTQAKRLYEDVHRRYPDNVECLRYLVHISKELGLLDDASEWLKKLKRLEAFASGVRPIEAAPEPSPAPEPTTALSSPASVTPPLAMDDDRNRSRGLKRDDDDEVDLPGM
jgi:intraflagellar transport protein 88